MTQAVEVTESLLTALQQRWREHGLPISRHLRPGLPDDAMDSLTAPLGLSLPGEARRWWGWHDGVEVDGVTLARDRAMTGTGFGNLSLAEAVSEARARRQHAAEAAGDEAERLWQPTWMPFAVNSGGGVAAFDCARPEVLRTPIHVIDWHRSAPNDLHGPQAPSLGLVVEWWIEAFDSGAYRYDSGRAVLERRDELVPAEATATWLV